MDLYWQEAELQLLAALISRLDNRTVIDVGAERGVFAEALLRAGSDEIHLVEPEPLNAEALRARFADDVRVTVHEYAVSDADRPIVLHTSVSPSGEPLTYGHTVLERPDAEEIAWSSSVSVTGRTLASLVEEGALPAQVGILKVDTEGHDLAVVSAMGSLRCDVVVVEHWTELPGSLGRCPWTTEEMLSVLRPRGFSHFVLVLHRGEVALLRWDDGSVPRGLFANLVFVHETVIDRVWPLLVDSACVFAEQAIRHFEGRLQIVNDDRKARLETIERLDAALKETESDRQARLVVIEKLNAALKNRASRRRTRNLWRGRAHP